MAAAVVPRDVREFLNGYPDSTDDSSLNANLEFYLNMRRCRPDRLLIDELHEQWKEDYQKLEYSHGYIQWLFPIKEYGMNFASQPLQEHELQTMKADPAVVERVKRSYKIMLGFYGMELVSEETGEVRRAAKNWQERFQNLIGAPHNNLRISRILKCLSEFSLERWNAGFLLFVLSEQSEHGHLSTRVLIDSMDRWWANCVRDEHERKSINMAIKKVRERQGYVFSGEVYLRLLQKRKETGKLPELEGD
ncbi:opioid growth factor receptor conserved region-domain-containing protein [Epithele typhae]|uniref:opioid growth factor receptor conserved region-domain-containing protein n=1 Tax=Epithele typhae TaxID=378194 RepID=UPI002007B2EA|nr:opioid growth factor receptor conserved region-domain-containing protein [Epithele typhae]KAH9933202.1 opioid growth factor receptor conserved region-domain-containing protein [Epithele typhae]